MEISRSYREDAHRLRGARALLRWLLIAPFILLFTSCCATLGTIASAAQPAVDTASRLVADYRPWSGVVFLPLDPGILADIARDMGLTGLAGGLVPAGCFLSQADCTSPTPTATWPAATPTPAAEVIRPSPTIGLGGPGSSPTIRPTNTRTAAPPSTAPPTSTYTPIPTNTFTPSPTYTPAPTASQTPTPCPSGECEPGLGPPDGMWNTICPGTVLSFNLETPIVVDGDADPDVIYYERTYAPGILLDLVVLKIGVTLEGEWYMIFNWGDGAPDLNSSVGTFGLDGTEEPNAPIPTTNLVGPPGLQVGIPIDVDHAATPPPTGVYYWLQIVAPTAPVGTVYPSDNYTEVDSVEILPTPTPTP